MKVLFDTNVILDLLLDRAPFSDDAAQLLSKVETGEIIGYLCATTITTIYYLAAKTLGKDAASEHIRTILSLFIIAPVNHPVLENAMSSPFSDFEDAVIHESACHAGANYIVTRNISDFKKTKLPTFLPKEFLSDVAALKENRSSL